jgi:predicted RNA polymerase sigma factor
LTPPSAIALTLRAVAGLTTAEIARAFGVPEATTAQRISRAKRTVASSGEPFRVPLGDERPDRLRSVLHVLYLMFNEGYAATSGDVLARPDLSREAVRLARTVHGELPDDDEVKGLLALMLLTDARRPARADGSGDIVPLALQDRSLWDRGRIAEGLALVDRALASGTVGEYQLQAAIAAEHDRAPTADDTDWPRVLALYGLLEQLTGSPVVTLNRAVAVAMVSGPSAGLAVLDSLDAAMPRVVSVRAHLLELAGDRERAAESFRTAAEHSSNRAEQRYLLRQAVRLSDAGAPAPADLS